MSLFASTVAPRAEYHMSTKERSLDIVNVSVLVLSAVLQVVCVAIPGYIVARMGHFTAEKQKFLANFNLMLFTPCMIFTELASKMNSSTFIDLSVIPVLFVVMTVVSWFGAVVVSKLFRLPPRASNFVTAMAVFGNSNSLPIPLVMSLSATVSGLHWDRIPGDTDGDVAARGILYLVLFQQLGQFLRWSWGYHILLAPKDKYIEVDDADQDPWILSSSHGSNRDNEDYGTFNGTSSTVSPSSSHDSSYLHSFHDENEYSSQAPTTYNSRPSSQHDERSALLGTDATNWKPFPTNSAPEPGIRSPSVDAILPTHNENTNPPPTHPVRNGTMAHFLSTIQTHFSQSYQRLPHPLQRFLSAIARAVKNFVIVLYGSMNPPLWAMLAAVIVASIPKLQDVLFNHESFLQRSVTSALKTSGDVAIPLILVVLGGNLARSTSNNGVPTTDPEEKRYGKRILIASLISRLIVPVVIMFPVMALLAKYAPISILDDPIFLVVCFLLMGSPSALQLAQICQINDVFEHVMSQLLFQSYVVWILPSTLILVTGAVGVVYWAT